VDQFVLLNALWAVALLVAVFINWRAGYKRGVVDAYTLTTIPVVELLVEQGHITAKRDNGDDTPVDTRDLTAHLVRLALERKR